MENAESLAGKEYIDYLLAFLRGKKDEGLQQNAGGKKRKGQVCFHEFTKEECAKLKKTLAAEDMVYYFNVQEGLRVLVDSLYITPQALALVQELLEKNAKLQDDFQRQHLYEALIDYMQAQNQNAEAKTLGSADMCIILQILESGSLNEEVRANLSDKKKIKDLFLVVIRSIDIPSNKMVVSSLIQFISNLCYGTGKLKQMLARENLQEFMATIKQILDKIHIERKFEDVCEDLEQENKDEAAKKRFEDKEITDKSVLKNAIYAFIGNLCTERTLRLCFANDQGGILSQILHDFKTDLAARKFDWLDMMTKQIAVFINVSLETSAQKMLFEKGLLTDLEQVVMACKSTEPLQRQIIERTFNLLSKM